MSSPRQRLEIHQSLLDLLNELEKEGMAYQQVHSKDGLYDNLELFLREKLKDTRVNYVDDFANNYALIRFFKRECDELEQKIEAKKPVSQYSRLHAGMATNIRRPLERLLIEVGLFSKAKAVDEKMLAACDETLKELEALDKNSKEVMEMKV